MHPTWQRPGQFLYSANLPPLNVTSSKASLVSPLWSFGEKLKTPPMPAMPFDSLRSLGIAQDILHSSPSGERRRMGPVGFEPTTKGL